MSSQSCDRAAVDRARALFESSRASAADIARSTGLSATSVARYAKRETWRRPAAIKPDARPPAAASRPVEPVERLIQRLWATLERRIEIAEIAPEETPVRDLVALSRALRELSALDKSRAASAVAPGDSGNEDDSEALRAELVARLERIL